MPIELSNLVTGAPKFLAANPKALEAP